MRAESPLYDVLVGIVWSLEESQVRVLSLQMLLTVRVFGGYMLKKHVLNFVFHSFNAYNMYNLMDDFVSGNSNEYVEGTVNIADRR